MYLTQLRLNRLDRTVVRTLADIYRLHKTLMKGFVACTDAERVLFRVEPEEHKGLISILVQSLQLPDWRQLSEENRGVVDARIKEFNPAFEAGQCFRFRLRANPTVTREGKRLGLVRDEPLLEWLEKKQERLGARLTSFAVIDEGYIVGEKFEGERLHKLNVKLARFEGKLEVVDPDVFMTAVTTGIGPAKGFGCGLLSLARA